jgi:hypothetical protein
VIEYPLALLLACYLRPPLTMGSKPLIGGDSMPDRPTALGQSLDVLAAVAVGGLTYLSLRYGFSGKLRQFQILIPVIVCLLTMGRPLRFGLSLSALMLVAAIHDRSQQRLAYESRSFYGFLRVREEEDSEGDRYYALIHGGINHGWQSLDPERRRELLTYFHPKSGISQLFGTLSWPDARLPASLVGLGATPFGPLVGIHSEPPYAVVGLGIGTLAAHARPYQHVTFYEIDPAVIHLSKPPPGSQMYFTYIHDAEVRGADVEIIPGDGRLSLRSAPERYYHVLVLDAFSSDAIPVHLLTAQAIDLYLKKLADGGVLIFNTTNRYVDIRPVLADLARSRDLVCLAFGDWGDKENPTSFGSDWVVMQRRLPASGPTGSTFNGGLRLDRRDNFPHWDVPEGLGGRIWTDDYSNLLRVLHW